MRLNNSPQYKSAEFSKLARDWEFKHVTSSPLYALSNGEAERAVQTTENLLQLVSGAVMAAIMYVSSAYFV